MNCPVCATPCVTGTVLGSCPPRRMWFCPACATRRERMIAIDAPPLADGWEPTGISPGDLEIRQLISACNQQSGTHSACRGAVKEWHDRIVTIAGNHVRPAERLAQWAEARRVLIDTLRLILAEGGAL